VDRIDRNNWHEELCGNCGELYTRVRPWQRFCSHACRNEYHDDRRAKAMKLLEEAENEQSKEKISR
jgi:hypothetical protein